MSLAIWMPLKIDRLGMTRSGLSKEQRNFVLGQMHSFKEEQKLLLPEGRISFSYLKKQHAYRLNYYPLKTGPQLASITLGATPQKKLYMTLTVYPDASSIAAFHKFQETTEVLLDQFSYRYFHAKAEVTYIELALDSLSFKREELLLMRPKALTSHVFVRPDGTVGTLTLGGVSSPRRDRLYDKKRQLFEVHKVAVADSIRTRIEVAIRATGLRACELAQLSNPFSDLLLIPVASALGAASDPEWTQFVFACQAHGVPMALAGVPELRKLYKARLASAATTWWNPAFHWNGYPTQLAKIVPSKIEALKNIQVMPAHLFG